MEPWETNTWDANAWADDAWGYYVEVIGGQIYPGDPGIVAILDALIGVVGFN